MDKSQLEKKILDLEKEGFKEQEIREAMSKEGFSNEIIQEVFTDIKRRRQRRQTQQQQTAQNIQRDKEKRQRRQNSQQNGKFQQINSNRVTDSIKSIDLTEDYYKIRQNLIRHKYKIFDSGGNIVLRAKKKLFRFKEDIKFKDKDGNHVFEVKAQQILDVAGDYTLIDSETEEPVTVLEKNWTFLIHKWKIKDATDDERLIARFHTENKGRAFFRFLGSRIPFFGIFLSWIPHKYIIESADREEIGHMKGKISIRDTYELELGSVDAKVKESIIASAIAIDALEGN